jgi:hypothetical protein
MRNPDEIELIDLSKQFEYTRMCNEIDQCNDIEELKLAVKCYLKIYLATLETINQIQNI